MHLATIRMMFWTNIDRFLYNRLIFLHQTNELCMSTNFLFFNGTSYIFLYTQPKS